MKSAAVVAACFALADDAYRAGAGNAAIRAELERCLPEITHAMPCYEETLWIRSFFASKRGGVSLARALGGYPAGFQALIEEVYASPKEEAVFRRDRFHDCLRHP